MNFRRLLVSLFLGSSMLLFFACNQGNQATETSQGTTAQTANVAPTKAKKNTKGVVINLASTEAKSGEEVCVDFSVKDFVQVVSMQYSINWDPKILNFKQFRKFNLKDLTAANFGQNKIKEGKITFSWYDQAVKGINVADNTVVYQMCFDAIGKKGAKSKVLISEDPIIVEITGAGGKHLKFFTETAYVKVK